MDYLALSVTSADIGNYPTLATRLFWGLLCILPVASAGYQNYPALAQDSKLSHADQDLNKGVWGPWNIPTRPKQLWPKRVRGILLHVEAAHRSGTSE